MAPKKRTMPLEFSSVYQSQFGLVPGFFLSADNVDFSLVAGSTLYVASRQRSCDTECISLERPVGVSTAAGTLWCHVISSQWEVVKNSFYYF